MNTLLIEGIPVSEYFRYHPPVTEARKQKHETANTACLKLFNELYKTSDLEEIRRQLRVFTALMTNLVDNHTCRNWAIKSLEAAGNAATNQDQEAVLMHIQQIRMFINQGITIDELQNIPF